CALRQAAASWRSTSAAVSARALAAVRRGEAHAGAAARSAMTIAARALIVAPRAHCGAARQVGSLHSPPGREKPAASFARSLLHRALTVGRRDKSARCTRLPVAKNPPLRSRAHCCTARSLWGGATSRLAALASRSRKTRRFV